MPIFDPLSSSDKTPGSHSLPSEESATTCLATEKKLKELVKQKGFLSFKEGSLVTTDYLSHAKVSQVDTLKYLNSLEGKVDSYVLKKLNIRLSNERFMASVSAMPSADITHLLESNLDRYGLTPTLHLLEQVCDEKIKRGARYNAVSSWPERRETPFLHLLPNIQIASALPKAKGAGLLAMMEPSLTDGIRVGDYTFSNAKLLITPIEELKERITSLSTEEQESLLEQKKALDLYYQHKAFFRCDIGGRQMLITEPTTRYAPLQFIAVSLTDREDILDIASHAKEEKFSLGVEESLTTKSKTLAHFSTSLSKEEREKLLDTTRYSLGKEKIVENVTDIASMAKLIRILPTNTMIGQSSPDTSSDATYQHFQIFLETPCNLIPLFSAKASTAMTCSYEDKEGSKQSMKLSKINKEEFHGTIYRIEVDHIDEYSIDVLKKVQDDYLYTNNNYSSLNLVARKLTDGRCEFYYVLRKDITFHKELEAAARSKGATRPGWAEMAGMRIAKNEADFEALNDLEYEKIMDTFSVEEKECILFEDIASKYFK